MQDSVELQVWLPNLLSIFTSRQTAAAYSQHSLIDAPDFTSPEWVFGNLSWVLKVWCRHIDSLGAYVSELTLEATPQLGGGGGGGGGCSVRGVIKMPGRLTPSQSVMAIPFEMGPEGGMKNLEGLRVLAEEMFCGGNEMVALTMRASGQAAPPTPQMPPVSTPTPCAPESKALQRSHDYVGTHFCDFLDRSKFSDVEVVVDEDGQRYRCHKIVLASAGPQLEAAVRQARVLAGAATGAAAELHLSDVDGRVVEMFLQFVYGNSVEVDAESDAGQKLLRLARRYEVEDLVNQLRAGLTSTQPRHTPTAAYPAPNCPSPLSKEEIIQSACRVLVAGGMQQAEGDAAVSALVMRLGDAVGLACFRELPVQAIARLVSTFPGIRAQETVLFRALIAWVEADAHNRYHHLDGLLPHVRVERMTLGELMALGGLIPAHLLHNAMVAGMRQVAAQDLAARQALPPCWPDLNAQVAQPAGGFVHEGSFCDVCMVKPIVGTMHASKSIHGFVCCSRCVDTLAARGAGPYQPVKGALQYLGLVGQALKGGQNNARCNVCGVLPIVDQKYESPVNALVACQRCANHPLMRRASPPKPAAQQQAQPEGPQPQPTAHAQRPQAQPQPQTAAAQAAAPPDDNSDMIAAMYKQHTLQMYLDQKAANIAHCMHSAHRFQRIGI